MSPIRTPQPFHRTQKITSHLKFLRKHKYEAWQGQQGATMFLWMWFMILRRYTMCSITAFFLKCGSYQWISYIWETFPPFQFPTKGATAAELVGAVKGILGTFLRQTDGIVVLNFHLRKVTREVLKELLRSKKRSLKEGTLAWENFSKDRRKFWAFYWTFLHYFKLAQDELTYFWAYHRISPLPQMVKVLWNPIGWNQKGEFFSRPYLYVDK